MSLKTIAVTVYSGNVIHFMCLAKSCYLLYVYCCIVITYNSLSISRTSYRPTETFHMPTFRCVRLVSQHADDSWLKSSEDGCTRVRRWLHSSPKMGIHKSENRLLESEDGCTRDRARSQTTRRLRTLWRSHSRSCPAGRRRCSGNESLSNHWLTSKAELETW